jgi:hypothetical protein
MTETIHEQQNKEIRNIELRLERMEVIFLERNRKSDDHAAGLTRIETKFDTFIATLPKEYVSVREFSEYKDNLKTLLSERKDGAKSWQSWVMLLVPTFMSAIMTLYVIFGQR